MSYVVSDDLSSHRSISKNGVKLLIIDGDFLKYKKYHNSIRRNICRKLDNILEHT